MSKLEVRNPKHETIPTFDLPHSFLWTSCPLTSDPILHLAFCLARAPSSEPPTASSSTKTKIVIKTSNAASRIHVIGDLTSRRGRVQNLEARPGIQVIQALAPMGEMFGYATDLRSMTQGRGNYTMHFGHYEQVPKAIGEEVVARVTGTFRP